MQDFRFDFAGGGGRLDSPKNLVFSPILTQKHNESAFFVNTKNAPLSTQKSCFFNLKNFTQNLNSQNKAPNNKNTKNISNIELKNNIHKDKENKNTNFKNKENKNINLKNKNKHTPNFCECGFAFSQKSDFNLQLFAEKEDTQKKKKYLPLIISIFIIIALAIASIPVISIVTKKDTKAFYSDDTTNYVTVDEIWDSEAKVFNFTNLNTLISYLSTGYTSDTDVTAGDIRGYTANGKTSSQAVVVTLGGLKWQVVYLTNNTSGERTATLWLTNNEQDAFTGRLSDEGDYYGYFQSDVTGKTGLYSKWAANWSVGDEGWSAEFPSSMYGTSYIRAVTLNNGGIYATSSTTSETAIQNPDSAFAEFTMSTEGAYNDLTDFIVKPKNIAYQTSSQDGYCDETKYVNMNDSLATDLTRYNIENGIECNFQDNEYYTNWGSDNLWLPSIQETGLGGYEGIWEPNYTERKNHVMNDWHMSLKSGGKWSGGIMINTVLRTSDSSSVGCGLAAMYLVSLGWTSSMTWTLNEGTEYGAVRPALHLNLESAVLSAAHPMKATSNIENAGVITIEAPYNEIDAPYVEKNSEVTITATPNTGYMFDYWLVNGVKQTANPYTFTITKATTAVAYFREYEINITSPNTSLNIEKNQNRCDFINYFITPATSNLYIYSIQVDSNTAQVLKSRRGQLDHSGASTYIQYTVNEDNKQLILEIINVKGDINITLTYTDTNPNLPNTS